MASYKMTVLKNPNSRNYIENAEIWYSNRILTEEEIFLKTDNSFPLTRWSISDNDEVPEDLRNNINVWYYELNDNTPNRPNVNYFVLRDSDRNIYGYCRLVPPIKLDKAYISYFAVTINSTNIMLDTLFNKVLSYEEHFSNRKVLEHQWFGQKLIEFPWSGYYSLGSCYSFINYIEPSLVTDATTSYTFIDTPPVQNLNISKDISENTITPTQDATILNNDIYLCSHVYFRILETDLYELNINIFDLKVSTDITLGILLFALKDNNIYIFGSGSNLWNHQYILPNWMNLSYKYYAKVFFWKDKLVLVLDHTLYILEDERTLFQPIETNLTPSAWVIHECSVKEYDKKVVVPENFDLTEMIYRIEDEKVIQFNGELPTNSDGFGLNALSISQSIGGIFDTSESLNSWYGFLAMASQVQSMTKLNPSLDLFILDSGVVSIDQRENYLRMYLNNLRTPLEKGLISYQLKEGESFNGDVNGINILNPNTGLKLLKPDSTIEIPKTDARAVRGFRFSILNHTIY